MPVNPAYAAWRAFQLVPVGVGGELIVGFDDPQHPGTVSWRVAEINLYTFFEGIPDGLRRIADGVDAIGYDWSQCVDRIGGAVTLTGSDGVQTVSVDCLAGETAISGGYRWSGNRR